MRRRFVPARSFALQIQAFFLVNPISPLVIVPPAFTSEQNVNTREAVTDARFGDLFDALADGTIVAPSLRLK